MQFQKDGILIDVNKKHIKIFFENEEQKQKFDSKFVNFFKMKYPGRVVISDIISNQSLTKMMEIGNYDILDNMRSVLKKGIKTLGILMTKDIVRIKSGKFKYELYFKTPCINKGFKVVMFDDTQQDFKEGLFYEVSGTVEKDDYYNYKKTDYEIGFVPYIVKASSINELTDESKINSFDKHYNKQRHEFHLHTTMSAKDAFIREEDIIKAAKENKLAGAAITDHGVAHALPYFQNAINKSKQDIKLFFGMEAYLVDDTKVYNKLDEIVKKKKIQKLSEINPNISDEDLSNMIDEQDVYEECVGLNESEKKALLKEELQHEINDGKRYHITLLCSNDNSEIEYKGNKIKVNKSIKALNELITNSYQEGFSAPKIKENKFQGKRPCILKSWLLKPEMRNKFKIGAACAFGEIKDINMKMEKNDIESLKKIYNLLEFYDYVEIMPLHNDRYAIGHKDYPHIKSEDDLIECNHRLKRIVDEWNKNNPNNKRLALFTSDAHIMDKEEQELRSVFKYGHIGNILSKTEPEKVYSVYDEFKKSEQPFVFSYDEMVDELKKQKFSDADIELLYNNEKELADSLPDGRMTTIVPNFMFVPDFPGVNVKEEVPRMAKEFAIKKWSSTGKYEDVNLEIRERLEYEINKTAERNFEFLYYVAWHSVNMSKSKGFIVGSRGSIGSSLLAYSLGITENNPLPPHYHCDKCKKIIFAKDNQTLNEKYKNLCGWDFEDINCSCGHIIKGDGLNIDYSSFAGINGEKIPDIDLNFAGFVQSEIQQDIIDTFGTEHTSAAGTIKMFGEDQLKQNILSNIPKIQQHIINEDFDYNYMAKRLQCRESSGQHPKIA